MLSLTQNLHGVIVREKSTVLDVREERQVLLEGVLDRLGVLEAELKKPARTVALGIEERIHVEVCRVGPHIEERLAPSEVYRGREERQSLHRFRMQGRKDRSHRPPHAVPEDVECLPAVGPKDRLDGSRQKTTDVVLEGQNPVGVRRNPPVDHVYVEASRQELLDHTLVGLEIENVRPIDERVANEHRLGPRGR